MSDLLRMIDARAAGSPGFAAGGTWAVEVDHYPGLKFNAVLRGEAWLRVDGDPTPRQMRTGDCFLLTDGRPFRLSSDPCPDSAIPASTVFARPDPDGLARLGNGDTVLILGGKVLLDEAAAAPFRRGLPPLMLLNADSDRAKSVAWLLSRLSDETEPAPGRDEIRGHIVHWMMIELIRAGLDGPDVPAGWLAGLGDPRMARVLGALHERPPTAWTVEALADVAGMSRSSFAAHFKARIGLSPLDYLLHWRMGLSRRALLATRRPIRAIAQDAGYGSDGAFALAFRRVYGVTPAQYRRTGGTSPDVPPPQA